MLMQNALILLAIASCLVWHLVAFWKVVKLKKTTDLPDEVRNKKAKSYSRQGTVSSVIFGVASFLYVYVNR